MAKKKKHPEHANLERWLISYADFITLLFAFFVVMFSISQVDKSKLGRFVESIKAATRWGVFLDQPPAPIIASDDRGPLAAPEMVNTPNPGFHRRGRGQGGQTFLRGTLETGLQDLILTGQLSIVETDQGMIIRLPETSVFPRGGVEVPEETKGTLRAIAGIVRDLRNPVRIEGHTDSVPSSGRYRNNWELSAARAASVLGFFLSLEEFDARRFTVSGFADQRPIASNKTEEGRLRNRRVDILIVEHMDIPTDRPVGKTNEVAEEPANRWASSDTAVDEKKEGADGVGDGAGAVPPGDGAGAVPPGDGGEGSTGAAAVHGSAGTPAQGAHAAGAAAPTDGRIAQPEAAPAAH